MHGLCLKLSLLKIPNAVGRRKTRPVCYTALNKKAAPHNGAAAKSPTFKQIPNTPLLIAPPNMLALPPEPPYSGSLHNAKEPGYTTTGSWKCHHCSWGAYS